MSFSAVNIVCLVLWCGLTWGTRGENLTARHPPDIFQPKFTKTEIVTLESSLVLTCKARGYPQPTYRWQKDQVDVGNTTDIVAVLADGNLTLPSVTKREEGVYRCLASNTWGTAVSHDVHVLLADLGRFPKDTTPTVSARVGETVSLQCRSPPRSMPSGSYSWYTITGTSSKDAVSVKANDRIGLDENGTLHFSYVTGEDVVIGTYSCAVSNPKLNIINLGSKVKLEVQGAGGTVPQSAPQPITTTTYKLQQVGTTATLQCFFSGNPPPVIQWSDKNGKNILTDSGRVRIDDYGRELVIQETTVEDEGMYFCKAVSSLGLHTEQLYLNITSKPMWVEAPRSQTIIQGKDATIKCLARGALGERDPNPPMWFQNGEPMLKNDSRIVGYTEFHVKNVSRDRDIMNVQCTVENEFGKIFQNAYLNIILPIMVTYRPEKVVRYDRGDVITLVVSAWTDPSQSLEFQWKKDGQVITSPRAGFTFHNDSFLSINTTAMSEMEALATPGMYTCLLRDSFQVVLVDVYLTETPIDPVIHITSRPPTTVNVEHGDIINLSVKATTHPSESLNFRWSHLGQIILKRPEFMLSNDSSSLTINTSLLNVEEMEDILGGYSCNVSNSKYTVIINVILKPLTGFVTEGVAVVESGSKLWILAVVLGLLLIVGAAFLIACFLRQRYPKRVYLLEKKELKSKLDPVQDLENDNFKTM